MSTSTICRSKDGPANCTNPNCPERNHRAAREAQEKASFLTGILQSAHIKSKPSTEAQLFRDLLGSQQREEDELKARVAAIDATRSRRTYAELLDDPNANVAQAALDAKESVKLDNQPGLSKKIKPQATASKKVGYRELLDNPNANVEQAFRDAEASLNLDKASRVAEDYARLDRQDTKRKAKEVLDSELGDHFTGSLEVSTDGQKFFLIAAEAFEYAGKSYVKDDRVEFDRWGEVVGWVGYVDRGYSPVSR